MQLKHFFSDFSYLFRHTLKRFGLFSITKKIVLILLGSFLTLGALFYLYIHKVSFPMLLNHQEQQMDSIALFIQAEIEHIPELNYDRLDYVKRKMLENSHLYDLFIDTPYLSVGKALGINEDLLLSYHQKQALLAKRYHFEDGDFVLYYKADQYVQEVEGIMHTAYLTFALMFAILFIVALSLKLTLLPLTKLSSVMKNIDYNAPLSYVLPDISAKDERYDLMQAFKTLSFKQQEYAKRLHELNLLLEQKVEEKTFQLQELNDSLENRIENEVSLNRQKDKIISDQSRFAALGEMIGNISHQWRQPLSAISTAVGNAKIENMLGLATKESLDDTFSRIEEYTHYLSDTIDDFRNYFKNDKQKQAYYLDDILKAALSISKGSLNDIRILKEGEPYRTRLVGYPSELMQAFINIFNNARDVLYEKDPAKKYLGISLQKSSTHIITRIYDNGGGIPQELLSSVFDPYFTTKHKGQGTGIGLYMSKEIIEKHMDGSLTARNCTFDVGGTECFGACFTISLPYA